MSRGVKVSTLMSILRDLGESKPTTKKTKKSALSKGLKNEDMLKELRGIKSSLGLLPHQEGSAGGSSCE